MVDTQNRENRFFSHFKKEYFITTVKNSRSSLPRFLREVYNGTQNREGGEIGELISSDLDVIRNSDGYGLLYIRENTVIDIEGFYSQTQQYRFNDEVNSEFDLMEVEEDGLLNDIFKESIAR